MNTFFDSKVFNGEVFQKYVDRVPNTKLNELIKSRAVVSRQDLATAMADQVGGNYITTPLKGLISGATPDNYDGATNITTSSTKTFQHSRVVVGRAHGWTEKDFSYDITSGVDFMENVAQQIAEYWDEIDQDTLISILKGVFSMSDVEGAKFVTSHTYDVTAKTNSEGKTGLMDATTLNTGIQRACGDHKNKFSLALMHSAVATNLENLKILVYLKYNDANGMQRDAAMATLNGRLVIIDDSMPTTEVETTAGVYTVTLSGTWAADDTLTIGGYKYTVVSGSTSASAIATAFAAAYDGDEYTVTAASGKLTFTETTGNYGIGAPGVSKTSTAGVTTEATTTEPVVTTTYTTFVFGDGAIEYTNCGAKVPSEMSRNAAVNGGEDTLYTRQRKCFAPYGISFTKAVMSSLSPTNAELENGANWELVNSGGVTKEYISSKAIPIARIISLG